MSGDWCLVLGVWYEVCVWRSKWVGAFPLLVALSSSLSMSMSMFPSEASVGLEHNLWSYVSHTDRSQSKRAKHKKKTLQHNVDFNIFYVLCHDSNVNAQLSMGHTFSTHCFGARMLVVYEAFKNLCYFFLIILLRKWHLKCLTRTEKGFDRRCDEEFTQNPWHSIQSHINLVLRTIRQLRLKIAGF